MNTIITQSMIKSWKSCKRKFYYEYVRLLSSYQPNINFFKGTLLHTLVNTFHLNKSLKFEEIYDIVRDKAVTLQQKYSKRYKLITEDELNMIQFYDIILYGIVEGYSLYHNRNNFPEVVFVEKILQHEIHPHILLTGRIDEFVRRKTGKSITKSLYEIKSTRTIDNSFIEQYAIDSQISTYVILCEANNYEPDDTTLDCIKKPQIKQGKNESDERFLNRLLSLYKNNLSEYFYINHYPLRMNLLKSHYKSLKEDCIAIAEFINQPNPKCPNVNLNSCYSYFNPCNFVSLCRDGENEITLAMYRTKTSRNEELEE